MVIGALIGIGFGLLLEDAAVTNEHPSGESGPYDHLYARPLRGRDGEGCAAPIDEVLEYFNEEWVERLRDVPIYKIWEVRTALCYNTRYVDKDDVFIGVSCSWDDPETFSDDFKKRLLAHEYLHIIESEIPIDLTEFHDAVLKWYNDPQFGEPTPVYAGNYVKYILSYWLYDNEWDVYSDKKDGIEEFAYIGAAIIDGRSSEVADYILDYYQGIFGGRHGRD